MKFRSIAILAALLLVPLSAGADTFPQERTPKANSSFNPPITPALTGLPGPNVYLRTMGAGPPIWAPVPAASAIPAGTGWVKQNPAGTFGSFASVPSVEASFSPSVPGNWSLIPTTAQGALDQLAAQLAGTNVSVSALQALAPRYCYVNGGVGSSGTGGANSPKKTIAECFAIIGAGDVVHVASGSYSESLSWPNLEGVKLEGEGPTVTIVTGTAGAPTLQWVPGAGTFYRAVVPDQVSPMAGVYRRIELVLPQSGAGSWRVSNVDW